MTLAKKNWGMRVTLKSLVNVKKTVSLINRPTVRLMYRRINGRQDQQMVRPRNVVGYRVACTQLENLNIFALLFL